MPDMSLAMHMDLHIKFLLCSFNFTENFTGSATCHKFPSVHYRDNVLSSSVLIRKNTEEQSNSNKHTVEI